MPTNTCTKFYGGKIETWHSYDGGKTWVMVSSRKV